MDILFPISLMLSLLSLGLAQTYPVLEANDGAIKTTRTMTYTGSTLEDINFKCSYNIPNARDAYIAGDYSFTWHKKQDIDAKMPMMADRSTVLLNHGNIKSSTLDEEISQHITYTQGITDTLAWTQITVTTARPEDSGMYTCKLELKDTTKTPTSFEYTLNVLDVTEFEVLLYSNDNPMMVDRKPNTTEWMGQTQIDLREKMTNTGGPQEYAYLACVAQGTGKSAVITMSIVNTDDPSRDRDLHPKMDSLVMKEAIGKVPAGQRLNVRHLLEDRQFVVNGLDDGSTVRCTARIEDEDNALLKQAEATATMNLLSKPQFLNCSKQLHAPVGAQNYVITCKIRSKPTLTSAIEWKVQPKLGDEFTIPKQNNYGYVIDVISEGENTYMAKLTIQQVTATEHLQSLFKVHVENDIGSNEFSILLLEGKDDRTGQTTGSSICLSSGLIILLVSALSAVLVQ